MRSVVQRVSGAKVLVEGQVSGEIAKGLLVLLGVEEGDTDKDARIWPTKSANSAYLKMGTAR